MNPVNTTQITFGATTCSIQFTWRSPNVTYGVNIDHYQISVTSNNVTNTYTIYMPNSMQYSVSVSAGKQAYIAIRAHNFVGYGNYVNTSVSFWWWWWCWWRDDGGVDDGVECRKTGVYRHTCTYFFNYKQLSVWVEHQRYGNYVMRWWWWWCWWCWCCFVSVVRYLLTIVRYLL